MGGAQFLVLHGLCRTPVLPKGSSLRPGVLVDRETHTAQWAMVSPGANGTGAGRVHPGGPTKGTEASPSPPFPRDQTDTASQCWVRFLSPRRALL